jgi:hypothetical protein
MIYENGEHILAQGAKSFPGERSCAGTPVSQGIGLSVTTIRQVFLWPGHG